MLDDRGKRITENIFDIIMKNPPYEGHDPQFDFDVDTADMNVFVDKHQGLIQFEDHDGNILYELKITKHE